MLFPGEVISYMCREEGVNLQRGLTSTCANQTPTRHALTTGCPSRLAKRNSARSSGPRNGAPDHQPEDTA